MQESLLGRHENLYSFGPWSEGCQIRFYVVHGKSSHDMSRV